MSRIKCPFCDFLSDESAYRSLRETWKFNFYTVRRFECPNCSGVFNYYEGVSPRGKHSVFVIRVRPRGRK